MVCQTGSRAARHMRNFHRDLLNIIGSIAGVTARNISVKDISSECQAANIPLPGQVLDSLGVRSEPVARRSVVSFGESVLSSIPRSHTLIQPGIRMSYICVRQASTQAEQPRAEGRGYNTPSVGSFYT